MNQPKSKKGVTTKQMISLLAVIGCLSVMFKFGFQVEAGLRIDEQQFDTSTAVSLNQYGNNQKTVKNYSFWINANGASKVALEHERQQAMPGN
jgi:hypothetical protein